MLESIKLSPEQSAKLLNNALISKAKENNMTLNEFLDVCSKEFSKLDTDEEKDEFCKVMFGKSNKRRDGKTMGGNSGIDLKIDMEKYNELSKNLITVEEELEKLKDTGHIGHYKPKYYICSVYFDFDDLKKQGKIPENALLKNIEVSNAEGSVIINFYTTDSIGVDFGSVPIRKKI